MLKGVVVAIVLVLLLLWVPTAHGAPPPIEWTEGGLQINWGSVGAGIAAIVLTVLLVWAYLKTMVVVLRAFVKRTSKEV